MLGSYIVAKIEDTRLNYIILEIISFHIWKSKFCLQCISSNSIPLMYLTFILPVKMVFSLFQHLFVLLTSVVEFVEKNSLIPMPSLSWGEPFLPI